MGNQEDMRRRISTRLSIDEHARTERWAAEQNMTVSDYLREAILFYNKWNEGNVDLTTLEVQRLNQLIDSMAILASNVHSLEQIAISGFDSLLNLTRGDNYLLDDFSGDRT